MDLLEKLKSYYKINDEEYLSLIKEETLDTFNGDHHFENIIEAVNITKETMNKKGKIIIYGDFDCDGIMATSILKKMFKMLNYEVSHYIPSRYKDGYGLNDINASKIKEIYDLVITVDNGISANSAISILKEASRKVIVIDHHTVQLPLPDADAIIHPEVSHYGDIPTSGGYCAFIFSYHMLGYYDKYLSTLAAISLVSDMMPLKEYNRRLLKAVIKDYKDGEFLALSLLTDHKKFDEALIGSLIAPRINAVGRMVEDTKINQVVKYFTEDDPQYILTYFKYMTALNEERKNILKEANEKYLNDLTEDSLVLRTDIKEGLIGLIAASIANKLNKPCIVFTSSEEGILKGSARSIEGFNIMDVFTALKKYMIHAGGHAGAGGCSIYEKDFDNFKIDFINLVKDAKKKEKEQPYIDISINDISIDNSKIYLSFSPFGEGNEAPLLKLKHIATSELTYSKNKDHIIKNIGTTSKIVGFFMNEKDVSNCHYISLYGSLALGEYFGRITSEFHAKKFEEDK